MQTATATLLNLDFQQPDSRQKFQQLAETASRQMRTVEERKLSEQAKARASEDSMITLWQRLGETFGASFLNQFGAVGEEAFETWSLGLRDVSPKQIESGFIAVLKSNDKFPPNLKTFRAMCFDLSRYGLPDANKAYLEAALHSHEYREHQWSHEAVYKTLLDVGVSVMRELPESQSKPLFAARYQLICDMVIAGKDLGVELPKAIPSKIPNYLSPEENQKRMAAMMQELGL